MTDVSIRTEGRLGHITLARPKALNALTPGMIAEITRALDVWADDPGIALVLFDGEGERAFCAGGDIRRVHDTARTGDFATGRRFFRDEYVMNARIGAFPKPVVVLMHGFTMGGGVGIGGNASHRIVGETAILAMPECAIGLIPDVGGTHLLARAPGSVGEYLGLTGARMSPADAIFAGFADSLIPERHWPDLIAELAEHGDTGILKDAAETPPRPALSDLEDLIDPAFDAPDLDTIVARLEVAEGGMPLLKSFRDHCPLSLVCTLALIREARRTPGLVPALQRELRFTWRSMSDGDLIEGIRAAIVDRDRAPLWSDTLDGVTPARAAAMLAPLGENDLHLPGKEHT